MVIDPNHEAAVDGGSGEPRVERDFFEVGNGDGPEVFWDEVKCGVFGEMIGDLVLVEPAAPSTSRGDEFGHSLLIGMDVIEETSIDELLSCDFFVAISFREVIRIAREERELVFPEAGEFAVVVVASVWAGESGAVRAVNGEVELGGEFEVNEISSGFLTKEEIELADCRMDVFADLQIFFEKLERGGF